MDKRCWASIFSRAPGRAALAVALLILFAAQLCAQWEADKRVTVNGSESLTSVSNAWSVAASGDTVHVVWKDYRDGNPEIYYNRSTDGGLTWGTDARLTANIQNSQDPSVAVADSCVHVVWVDYRDINWEVYYKRSTDRGATWGADVRLTVDPGWAGLPSLAASGSWLHVVWYDNRDGYYKIYYKRSTDSGTSWEPDAKLTDSLTGSSEPSAAVSGGNVYVVWRDSRDGNNEIYFKRSTNRGTTWDPDVRLTSDTANSVHASVAASGSSLYVVWQDHRDGNDEIYFKRSTDSGLSWGADVRLTTDAADSWFPSVAASGSMVHVVWQDTRDGANGEVYYKRSTDGGATWGPDTRLTTDPSYTENSTVAASGTRVHVVWSDYRVGNWEVYYKRNPTGGLGVEGSQPVRLTPYASRLAVFPNPFISFATVPGHEGERFNLYDIAGQRAGAFSGDRIGEGLPPGVYFLKPDPRLLGSGPRILRLVKVR